MQRNVILACAGAALALAGNAFGAPVGYSYQGRDRDYPDEPLAKSSYLGRRKWRSGGKKRTVGKYKGSKQAKRATRLGGNHARTSGW